VAWGSGRQEAVWGRRRSFLANISRHHPFVARKNRVSSRKLPEGLSVPKRPATLRAARLSGRSLPNIREESMVTHVDVDVPQLWRDYRAEPTVELRNQLVEHYLPLVKYNAERIWARLPEGVDLDDLISAGVFGLMDAIDAFDLERGVKFETYCVPRIRGAMLDELRTMDWVPRLVRSKHTKLEEARKSLEAEYGRPPTTEEMAAKLGLSIDDYEKMAGDATAVSLVSLN